MLHLLTIRKGEKNIIMSDTSAQEGTHLPKIFRKKQQKGCQNESKSDSLQTCVSTSNINKQHLRITLTVSWGLRDVWLGRVEGICVLFMPK